MFSPKHHQFKLNPITSFTYKHTNHTKTFDAGAVVGSFVVFDAGVVVGSFVGSDIGDVVGSFVVFDAGAVAGSFVVFDIDSCKYVLYVAPFASKHGGTL